MNKIKQLYKTFLSKWNDGTLYKTSYITNRGLFRHSIYTILLLVMGGVFLCVGLYFLGNLSLVVSFYLGKGVVGIYKSVADSVPDEEEESDNE